MNEHVLKIDLLLLTYERSAVVERSLDHNLLYANYPINSIIHVDNSEKEDVCSIVKYVANKYSVPLTQCKFDSNKGVAVGYNTCISLSRAPWIAITGCDWYMPENWVRTYVEHIEAIPNTAYACMLQHPMEDPGMRPLKMGKREIINGKDIQKCLMFSRRIMRREMFSKMGYFREDLGAKYGFEDVEIHTRLLRYLKETNQIGYNIPNQMPRDADTGDDLKKYKKYWDWKKDCIPQCKERMNEIARLKYPYYTPF